MNAAIIAAAGSGSRTGLNENKIFFVLDGKEIIRHSVNAFLEHKDIDEVYLVCREDEKARLEGMFGESVKYVVGGSTRGESVLNGLKKIDKSCEKVLIHDGARPFVSQKIISDVLENIESGIGAISGVRTLDTVKVTDGENTVVDTPPRKSLWNAQTPQGFMLDEIITAYEKFGTDMTDDGCVYEKAGFLVKMVEGEYSNKKITTPEDVKGAPVFLTGIGYDVHQLVKDRKLILGGVEIPHSLGLKGHSDADVLVHAIMDAILGAAGLGDIGKHFPDTDEKYKGADSMLLFEHVISLIRAQGLFVVNISAIVVAQKPKLAGYIDTMRANISVCAGVHISRVNVAATTTEHLGFEGREEGISAQATVMLMKE